MLITELNFKHSNRTRIINILHSVDIRTVDDLLKFDPNLLYKSTAIGKGLFLNIKQVLVDQGFDYKLPAIFENAPS